MKKIAYYIVIIIGFLSLMTSCSDSNEQQQAVDDPFDSWKADSASLRVAVTPTIDCLPLFVAESAVSYTHLTLPTTPYV